MQEVNNVFMKLAIQKALEGIENGQSPFGACIVKDGLVIAVEHNKVRSTTDITAHAEIVAIRTACKEINSIDLSGAVIYSTCEPCPMCFGAIHWARIDTIIYGANIADATTAGFNELIISNQILKDLSGTQVNIISDVLQSECQNLFEKWINEPNKLSY